MLDYIHPEEEQRFFTDREYTFAVPGFIQEALEFARHNNIMLSSQADLEALAKLVIT